ncbi:MAG TPA: cadherin-like domain-containing protein, partial [Methylobacter sp.]
GTSSTSGTTYNLAAAEDWTAGAAAGVTDADLTGNGITVSNVAVPAITSSTYDATTGALVVTGTGFLSKSGATNDIVANKFTFTGEGGATYALTDSSNVEITSGTAFTITLSATDKAAINQMINKNGTSSTSGTTYNLAAAEDWTAGAAAGVTDADLTGNGITVSNVTVPAITSATYDYNTNILVVTGTDFLSKSGATNDIDLTKLTFTGEGGATYALTNATGVEITSATSFSVTLSGADLTNVEALLNKDGTAAVSTTTYNLSAAASWNRGDATNGSDTTNAITVSNYAAPTVTSATYDAGTNVLTVTGANLVSKSGATNDVAVSLLTLTGEGGNYTLTSSNVEITNDTTFSITLNAADQVVVRGLMNKNGTSSSGATTYNLAAAEDWMAGTAVATVVADLTGNGITVSNVQTPTITSSTYDSDTGVLTVTGTNLFSKVGANNDIDLTKLTFTGQGAATYTLTNATGVEITSATSFTTTLTGADKTNVDALLNKIGTSANDATTYNLAGADDWLTGADAAANIADAVNAVTVSIAPKITSATYDAATGSLVVTGTNMQAMAGATNDITANKLTFTGEGGATYTLTDTANVELISATSFTLALSATDQAAINQIVNKNGTSSTGATTYNLAAADDWNAQVTAGDTSDLTGNGITASNVAVPAITSSTYNAATGSLVVTGTGFLKLSGATNDIVANKFTFTGEGGATYTLTDTSNVEITSGSAFTIALSATDKAAINQMINKNGTSSTGATTYNLAAAEDWTAGAAAGVTDADLTGNGITVSNVAVPAITSSTYDASTGSLVVIGTGFLKLSGATNDIVANKFTFTGEGGATYTLTDTSNVEITSGTAFTITLSATDKAAINQMINKNGTSSTGATTYNLAAAEDWAAGAAAGVTDADLTGNGITASNVAVPAITSSTYDAATGALVVTGTGFLSKSGATNDIVANKFTFTGEGGATYTLTDTSNVEITSGTAFTITLSATDKAAINQMINKNGTSSTGATTYNLAAAEDWTAGAAAGVTDADLTGNGITASNVAVPAITSSTYDASTGALVVTGTDFLKLNGTTNDIVANKFTFTGEGGATYTLTDTSNVEITSGTAFTITLSATDKAAINQIINKNGTSSTGATTYNLAAAEDWTAGAAAGITDADLTGNGITASNVAVPTITSATYVNNTGVLVVTGANFLKKAGASNDIDASKLTFTGQGGATYTLTGTASVEITSATQFTLTLTGADKTGVNALVNKNGLNANDNTVYNLAAAEDWAAGADVAVVVADLTNNGITATVNVPPTSINSSITVNEDTSYTFAASDFNFSDVDTGNVLTQVQITALPSSGTLALNGTAVTANQAITKADIDAGKLTFRGAADAFGTANTSFQFKVHDGTDYSTTSYTETVNITAVNDAPSFTKGADQAVNEDAGAQTVSNWATGLSKGPANEADQTLSFTSSNNNNALFSVQPTIDSNGNLTYTPAANANGTATVTVSIKDSGGTVNGGVDTSATQTFTITVNPVNDLPTGTVTVSGTPSVGNTLSAANTLADVDGLGAISYQWQANGININGATGSSYVLTDAEVGKTITVVARYLDAQGTAESVASAATAQVDASTINLSQQTGNNDNKPSSDTGTGTGNNTNTGNTGNTGTGINTGVDRNNNANDTHGSDNSNTNNFGNNNGLGNNNNSNSGSSSNQTIVVDMKLSVDSHGNGTSGGTINIPSSAFAGLNTTEAITISASQSSGQSLPSFISVNPSTGAVTVKEGAVITSPITVKVTIRDSQGKQVVVLVKVQPQKGKAQGQGQGQGQGQQPDDGDRDNSQGQGNQRTQAEQLDKQLAHAGKPGLTQQLQMVGSKGFELQRQKLLDSLASLVSNDQDAA